MSRTLSFKLPVTRAEIGGGEIIATVVVTVREDGQAVLENSSFFGGLPFVLTPEEQEDALLLALARYARLPEASHGV